MAAICEMMSFLNEFVRLNATGVDAKLEFHSVKGKVSVNFNAEFGYVLPPPSQIHSPRSNCKPSRVRRRRRRAKARENGNQCQRNSSSPCNDAHEFINKTYVNDSLENVTIQPTLSGDGDHSRDNVNGYVSEYSKLDSTDAFLYSTESPPEQSQLDDDSVVARDDLDSPKSLPEEHTRKSPSQLEIMLYTLVKDVHDRMGCDSTT